MGLKVSREGVGTILAAVAATALLGAGALLSAFVHLKVLATVGVALTGLVVFFFRDPERAVPEVAGAVVSPADGRVVEIADEFEKDYLNADATRVSIFLSVFDVHVNRIPFSGTVGYFDYRPGGFLKAYKREASTQNEQTVIGIEDGDRRILFKQIAGLLARRIVCHVREGHRVRTGERFGIIKFGSRVDVFLPRNAEVRVALRQKVKGGESIIGVFKDES